MTGVEHTTDSWAIGEIVEHTDDARLAAEIAKLTRTAYAGSDPVPGLPRPDGANDTADSVRTALAEGVRIWLTRDQHGEAAGALRITEHRDGTWEVHRVAVLPTHRGHGLAGALLSSVERAAVSRGVHGLWLAAVVERCLPPLYHQQGYRPVFPFYSPGKLLTEWRMARRLDESPDLLRRPWHVGLDVGQGWFLCWFLAGDGMLATLRPGVGDLTALVTDARAALRRVRRTAGRLVGVDFMACADAGDLITARLMPVADSIVRPGVFLFRRHRQLIQFNIQPRLLHPALMSLWRYAPGREPDWG